ncbi:hypothetical protein [Moraxella sp. VT-16-12]|uniref:hypothetical protein n=1 Tax=Moraxella sp. VT-16-12 TaxID=2014877 RepID=UPI000B7CAAC2|nr:hypothetical protein [Moraxella sp. VT-16-12]TWV80336.1 hypothetical protein CEW93_010275 [Moraxella sp. VT-16-12]
MKKLLTLLAIITLAGVSTAHAKYLCSYTAYISQGDKYNSSGKFLGSHANRATAAAILQQDRANAHRFTELRDEGDNIDCYFNTTQKRKKMAAMLQKGSISQAAINDIVHGDPVVNVEVHHDRVHVTIE